MQRNKNMTYSQDKKELTETTEWSLGIGFIRKNFKSTLLNVLKGKKEINTKS